MKGKLKYIIVFLLGLFVLSYLVSLILSLFIESQSPLLTGNVVLIPIKGMIVGEESNAIFERETTASPKIVEYIKKADKNPSVKAIMFEINSPGGTALASKEIVDAVKKSNKFTVSYIREIGTSGAYWVASATDKIIADELSITGSIGVISSYLEFSGFLQRYNITYQRLVGGEYKDIGTPLKPLTPPEKSILQEQINLIHNYFMNDVAKNRNLSEAEIKEIANGMFYLGSTAKELGLIDLLGNKETAIELVKKEFNLTEVYITEFRKPRTFFESLANVFSQQSFFVGKGIGSSLTDASVNNKIEVFT